MDQAFCVSDTFIVFHPLKMLMSYSSWEMHHHPIGEKTHNDLVFG
jgi:hypothetical protein